MKLAQLTLALAVCGVLCATSARADDLRYPPTILTVSADRDYYAYFDEEEESEEVVESPSDMVIEDDPLEPIKEPSSKDCCGKCDPCGKGCGKFGGRGRLACMCEGDAWSLWSTIAPQMEECHNVTAGGWFQIGYHTEGKNGFGTGLFNNYPGVIQMQQAWLFLEKAIDGDRCKTWDWGFRMDYVYGTDGQDTQAFGNTANTWDNGWDNGAFYGHAVPQLYFQVAYNDLTVTIGHFYTIIGYEVVPAPDNFFYSHAFTMVLAEPFTHTGVLAEYAVNDNITAWGGWTAGWDTGFQSNGGNIFLGGVSVQATERVGVTWALTAGDFGFQDTSDSDPDAYSQSVVIDVAVTEKLNYVFQTDYVTNDVARGGLGDAWGVNQYVIYSINDCLGVGGRLEYFDDPAIVGGEVWSFTLGTNIKPHANVVLRPELRWDDFDPATGLNDTFVFGMDMIMTF